MVKPKLHFTILTLMLRIDLLIRSHEKIYLPSMRGPIASTEWQMWGERCLLCPLCP
jgi:hypothetical protein